MAKREELLTPEQALRASVAARVTEIYEISGETPTEFAGRMGMSYKDFWNALKRQSFPIHRVMRLAVNLNVSMDYLCCLTDEATPIQRSPTRRDFWAIQADADTSDLKKKLS